MIREYYVYIMTNKRRTVFYIGVTNNLVKRTWEHEQKSKPGFTARYNVDTLVYYEMYNDVLEAITREKQLKNWHRQWKMNLVSSKNPMWHDLWSEIVK